MSRRAVLHAGVCIFVCAYLENANKSARECLWNPYKIHANFIAHIYIMSCIHTPTESTQNYASLWIHSNFRHTYVCKCSHRVQKHAHSDRCHVNVSVSNSLRVPCVWACNYGRRRAHSFDHFFLICVCVCGCLYIYIYMILYVYIYMILYIYIYISTHTHVHVYLSIRLSVCPCVRCGPISCRAKNLNLRP
jgi:hypothetical protein